MGGVAKGLLVGPSGPIVRALAESARALGLDVVLVGDARAYESLALPSIADDPPNIGPVGGLAALLRRAGDGRAISLGCDMPYVSRALLGRLAAHESDGIILAPQR